MTKPRVCIVSHNAYGAMSGGTRGQVGGVEWQTSLTARWLADNGYSVSMVTWDEGQDDEVMIDGVRVIKMCRQDAGVPGLRFLHPRWTSLNRALRAADADVYYHNCAEYITGQVAWWCRANGRKFVYTVANNMDCDRRLPELRKLRERVLYRYGLRHADYVVAQTRHQQSMLRENFGVDSEVIPMPCPGAVNGQYQPPVPPAPGVARIVWVARISPFKRLEWLLDVAEVLPEMSFEIVGVVEHDNDYSRGLMHRCETLSNVTFRGRVAREQMPEVYRNATCLCCTAIVEGFPNTFLEAWSQGIPIVSTYDPDDLIATHELGAAAHDVESLAAGLSKLHSDPSVWQGASQRSRQYYLDNHTVDTVLPRFEKVFIQVANGRLH
jgi:glycosyltransferase involved in cell wall biosynthesis